MLVKHSPNIIDSTVWVPRRSGFSPVGYLAELHPLSSKVLSLQTPAEWWGHTSPGVVSALRPPSRVRHCWSLYKYFWKATELSVWKGNQKNPKQTLLPPRLLKLQKANEGLIDGGIEVERRERCDKGWGGVLPEWGRRNVLTPSLQVHKLVQHMTTWLMQNVEGKKERMKNGASLLYHLPTCLLTAFLEAGVSSLAAVWVPALCSCGVPLVSPPALRSHPWWELVGGSLRSRVPESPLCAPPGWCSPASLPRRTCSKGGGASGERAEGSRAESPAWENGRARGTGSESGNVRWSSSSRSGPLWAPGAGWGWRIWGWSVGVWSARSAGRSS